MKGGKTATLAAGTYCFHNVTVGGGSTLRTAGAVVLTLNAKLDAGGGSTVAAGVVGSVGSSDPEQLHGRRRREPRRRLDRVRTVLRTEDGHRLGGGSIVFGSLLGKTLNIGGDGVVHYDTH